MGYGGRTEGGSYGGHAGINLDVSANSPSASNGVQSYREGSGQVDKSTKSMGEVSPTLILLVLLESVALIALRRGFRNFHGG